MNARLQETISGIEVVKSSAQEDQERATFTRNARSFRDYFVAQGNIEARYLPLLLLSIGLTGGFLHAVILYRNGDIQIGTIVAYLGMFGLLRFPTFISIFTFSLVQLGFAGARRILELINDETDLDENPKGYRGSMEGDITFEKRLVWLRSGQSRYPRCLVQRQARANCCHSWSDGQRKEYHHQACQPDLRHQRRPRANRWHRRARLVAG